MEKEIVNNEEVMETLTEGTSMRGGLSKVVIVGAVIAAGVATVMFIKKRRAKMLVENEPVIVDEKVTVKKTKKTEE